MRILNVYMVVIALSVWFSCNMGVSLTDKGGATDTPNAITLLVFPDSISGQAAPSGVVKIVAENYNAFDGEGYIDSTIIKEDSTFTLKAIPGGTYFLYVVYREQSKGVRITDIIVGNERDSIVVTGLDSLASISGGVYRAVNVDNRVGVEGINVFLSGSDFMGITGKGGEYVIQNVPVGVYKAVLGNRKTSGVLNVTKRVDLLHPSKTIVVDFTTE
jgi:hypothetical protein